MTEVLSVRRPLLALLLGLLLSMGVSSCASDRAPNEMLVFAAASLRDLAVDLRESFERESGVNLVFNFAGSNVLAQQIAAAPSADVFLSADTYWIDYLEDHGRIAASSKRDFVCNRLVVVGHRDEAVQVSSARDLVDADYRYLAIADPMGVPAGRYAKEWLAAQPCAGGNVWDAVAERVAPAPDVRAALALVEADSQAVGIVYASDLRTARKARVLFMPPEEQQPPIRYRAVVLSDSSVKGPAKDFLAFLASSEARAIYRRHGFEAPVQWK